MYKFEAERVRAKKDLTKKKVIKTIYNLLMEINTSTKKSLSQKNSKLQNKEMEQTGC